jgi:5-methylcytosine-specific restriction endonuclease McrA
VSARRAKKNAARRKEKRAKARNARGFQRSVGSVDHAQLRLFVLRRDNFCCHYCGKGSCKLTLDHVKPRKLGGSDSPSNLVAACQTCNDAKGSKSPREWEAWLSALRPADPTTPAGQVPAKETKTP